MNEKVVHIIQATEKHLKDIAEIFRVESAKIPYLQRWTSRTAFEKIKNSLKKDMVHVAIIEGKVVGFIVSKLDHKKKEAYVDELWIKKEHQGKGIGRKIMDFAEKEYEKLGMELIMLMANEKARAVKFYKKLNFKEKHRFIFFTKKIK